MTQISKFIDQIDNQIATEEAQEKASLIKSSKTLGEFARDLLSRVQEADWQELSQEHLKKKLLTATDKAGEQKERKPREKESIVIIAEEFKKILGEYGGGISKLDGKLHLYMGSHWQPIESEEVQIFMGEFAEKLGHDTTESKIYLYREKLEKQLHQASRRVKRDPSKVVVNFLNGTLHISDSGHEMKPHNLKDGITYRLEFDYSSYCEAPVFQSYLDRVLPDKESQTVLAEFLGWIFLRDLKLEKMLVLLGDGHNGKSVLFDVINALLGEENVSSVGLGSFNKPERRTALLGKLLNYGSEISGNVSPDTLKQMASGEKVEFRRLYGDNFTSDNYARLAFNANTLPSETEMTRGYFRRFLILPFEQVISDEEKDPDLASKIIESELCGVMNWILAGADRLRKTRKFSKCAKSDRCLSKYQEESNTVALYAEESNIEADTAGEGVAEKELYQEYRLGYCIPLGHKPCSFKTFKERMAQLGFIRDNANRNKKWMWLIKRVSSF